MALAVSQIISTWQIYMDMTQEEVPQPFRTYHQNDEWVFFDNEHGHCPHKIFHIFLVVFLLFLCNSLT